MVKFSKQGQNFRRVILDVAIIVGISATLILISEAFLRTCFPQHIAGISLKGERFSESDETLGKRYVPGARWRFTHPEFTVDYEINRDGFRDKQPHPVPKPPHSTRVLLVGDSFTFGWGVSYDQTWPVLIEKRLQEQGIDHIDLVKAGVAGYDTRSEFILMQRLLEQYQYDVVVVGFLINDLFSNTLDEFNEKGALLRVASADRNLSVISRTSPDSWSSVSKQIFVPATRDFKLHLVTLAFRIAIQSDALYAQLYLLNPRRIDFLTIPLSPKAQAKLETTRILFEKMAAYCKSLGKQLIVLSIPEQFQVLYFDKSMKSKDIDVNLYDRIFSDVASRNEFTWIPTLDRFMKSDGNKDKLFYRLDGHITPAGHELVADVFLQRIVPLISRN